MIHVYHGRGKGKTSAALGAALRAAGQGMPVLVVQFMKDARAASGEVEALRRMTPPVEVLRAELPYPIARPPGRKALAVLKENTAALWRLAAERLEKGGFGLAVLDELGIALSRGWLDPEPVQALLKKLSREMEIVITGRRMPRRILEMGDLVTRMVEVRHPYRKGVRARRGIEY